MKSTLKSSSKIKENLQYASNILSGGERRSELVTALNRLERASDLLPSNDSKYGRFAPSFSSGNRNRR